ncbi:MAG: glycosyltransferase family 39 protein [Bacteroidaceae bacterium]|nr:glycosyltransferase family 39 protein [Bacteroidaceae bacterium]
MKVSELLKGRNLLLVIAAVEAVMLMIFSGIIEYPDTPSYVSAWADYISNGHLDVLRTPPYPIILGISILLFGSCYAWAVCTLQHIAFIISVYCFYELCQASISNKRIALSLSYIYVLVPAFTGYNNALLTESFALSGIVFLLHAVSLLHKKINWLRFIYLLTVLSFLVLLRPAFLYLIPALIIYYGINFFINRKGKELTFVGIFATLFVTLIMFAYMSAFKSEYGVFSASRVSINNQLWIARNYGLLDPQYIDNQSLRDCVAEAYRKSGRQQLNDSIALLEYREWKSHDLVTLQNTISESMRRESIQWGCRCFGRTYRNLSNSPLIPCSNYYIGRILFAIGISLNNFILILFVSIGMLIWNFVRRKSFCLPFVLCILFSLGNLFTVVLAAPNDWNRLLYPSLPYILLLLGSLFSQPEPKANSLSER